MKSVRNHNNRNTDRKKEHEVAGYILTIVSGFLLLCTAIPFVLGIVSGTIASFMLGVFGFAIYPVLACLLIYGISLIRGSKLDKKYRVYFVCSAVIFLMVICILHLALTFSILELPFNEYISAVYFGPFGGGSISAGGVILGTLIYGIQAAVTAAFSFVMYSLVIAVLIFVILNKKFAFVGSKKEKPVASARGDWDSLYSDNRASAKVTNVTDKSLFVGKIEPLIPSAYEKREKSDEVKSFTSMTQKTEVSSMPYSTIDNNVQNTAEQKSAKDILFNDRNKAFEPYTPPVIQNIDNTVSASSLNTNQVLNEVKKTERPEKVVHSLEEYGLEQPVQIPFKSFDTVNTLADIEMGDQKSEELKSINELKQEKYTEPQVQQVQPTEQVQTKKAVKSSVADFINPINYDDYFSQYGSGYNTVEIKPNYNQEIEGFVLGHEQVSQEQTQREVKATQQFVEAAQQFVSEIQNSSPPPPKFNKTEPDDIKAELKYEEPTAESEDTSSESVKENFINSLDNSGYYTEVKPVEPKFTPLTPPKPIKKINNQIPITEYMAQDKNAAAPKPPRRRHPRYNYPPIELLPSSINISFGDGTDEIERGRLLEKTLETLKLPAKVSQITRGPTVTRYELEMPAGIPVKNIKQYVTDIEYYLAANGKIRLETPIPGKRAVGIEVPNTQKDIVALRGIIESNEFRKSKSPITLALGKDIGGTNVVCEMEKMPHMLIAGTTGSGKSVCLNTIILSIIYKSSPEDVRLILVDPKRVEFTGYKNLPHLLSGDIIYDDIAALNAFKYLRGEMERRYMLFSRNTVRSIEEYNNQIVKNDSEAEKLPFIVLIVDELADLMGSNHKKELEENIMSIAQKARAAGIHLILATQRPTVDVVTGTIKANLPSRIAFSLKTILDSRIVLDQSGAETLGGKGDMLYAPIGVDDPKRVQGAWVTLEETMGVVDYVIKNNEAIFDEEFANSLAAKDETPNLSINADDGDELGYDPLMPRILKAFIEAKTASTSLLQRRFSVGYARAARIIDYLEANKYIGPLDGGKPRAILITMEQFNDLFGEIE